MIARVATSTALNTLFDYLVPPELAACVIPGQRVVIPFGRRTTEGFVIELREGSSVGADRLKPIVRVVEGGSIPPELVPLAQWMSNYYMAPIETTLRAFLPAPVRNALGTHRRERLVVELVPPSQQPETPPKLTKRQAEVLEFARRSGGGFLSGLCEEWHATPGVFRTLEAAGLVRIVSREETSDPVRLANILPTQPLPLSAEQQAALDLVLRAIESPTPRPILLFGVTASGKTEVYLQAIAAVLDKGQGAIVLVPEIALTPQTIRRFAARFRDRVAVLHSALSDGERRDEWNRIRRGEARVVVGPRSAVLAPVANLGILIVDEEHEPSYKQEDAPRYHARDVAVMRGHQQRCAVVLGSATPSLESWRNAQEGKYDLAVMRERIPGAVPPRTMVVDMRTGPLPGNGGSGSGGGLFTQELVDAVRQRLASGEQVMLFLNRRGYSTSLRCPSCNHVETCESCGLPMTYHRDENVLRCHICGTFRDPPQACPGCGAPDLARRGIGTQRVEDIAKRLFPHAKVERMDADVTARRHSHEDILARFRARKIDILVGTQMIAKGLDFPNVTLVGILNADAGLYIPDFRAAERTFQLVAQMAGRAGRGDIPGTVLVQTRSPNHPAIDCARTEDYPAFANGELAERREAGFPPYTRVICLTFRGPDAARTEAYGARFAATLRAAAGKRFEVPDVFPSPITQVRDQYRFQLLLRVTPPLGPLLGLLRGTLQALEPPKDIHLAIDVDAMSFA